jgi:AraC-like DNA-binding protein
MPLFMDFHKEVIATMAEVVGGHVLDLAEQSRYGVKYHKYWMNLEEGTVYCLIEGPDKESCIAVHQASHGKTACQIVEVNPDFFKLFMGNGHFVGDGPMLHPNSSIDLGYRTILMIGVYPRVSISEHEIELIRATISTFNGREISWPSGANMIAVFDMPELAINCARGVQDLQSKGEFANVRIALGAGKPVTEQGEFFGEPMRLVQRLCVLADDGEIIISSCAQKLCKESEIKRWKQINKLRFVTAEDEAFVGQWFDLTDGNIGEDKFSIDKICDVLAISRPQLYRKVVYLSGRSPNELLQDQRLQKAFELIKVKANNISQIALEVGYSSPSYFSKIFASKFGIVPSKLISNVS